MTDPIREVYERHVHLEHLLADPKWLIPGPLSAVVHDLWSAVKAHATAPPERVDPERLAQMMAHRVCHAVEHNPLIGMLHGCCVVCGEAWPCAYAGPAPIPAEPEKPWIISREHEPGYSGWIEKENEGDGYPGPFFDDVTAEWIAGITDGLPPNEWPKQTQIVGYRRTVVTVDVLAFIRAEHPDWLSDEDDE